MQTVSVIIPVFNEENLVTGVIEQVIKEPIPGYRKEIVVIDDGSTDGTAAAIRKAISGIKRKDAKIVAVFSRKNEGKGAALKAGFRKATGDVLLVQDADMEYSTSDYPALVKPFKTNGTLVVYGSRNRKRENFHNRYSYFAYFMGGLLLTWYINILYGIRLTDQPTGYKVFSSKVKDLLLEPNEKRFSYEVAVTALLAKKKIKFIEVPIHYTPRTFDEGKKINFGDFVKSVVVGLKYRI